MSLEKEREFEQKVENLKKPRQESEFAVEEIRDLDHAIEILHELKSESYRVNRDVAFSKLHHAIRYLEGLEKKHLESSDEKTE